MNRDRVVSRWPPTTYVAFVDRLPKYLGDVICDLEARIHQAENTEATARQVGRQVRLALALLSRGWTNLVDARGAGPTGDPAASLDRAAILRSAQHDDRP